jgi:hypothetical protein
LGHSPFDFGGYNDRVVLDWGFLDIDGPLTDPSSHAVDNSHVLPSRLFSDGLQFQSIFFTDADNYPVAFDTGATQFHFLGKPGAFDHQVAWTYSFH